jgi:hypothetical protein
MSLGIRWFVAGWDGGIQDGTAISNIAIAR